VHELSIAHCLVEAATEALASDGAGGDDGRWKVSAVHLRLGRLAGVAGDSLEFCYGLAAQDTPLQGSRLIIHDLPVVVFCATCQREIELPDVQRFRCPVCDTPSGDIRSGRELDLESIELDEPDRAR
jgi:hydrogenase nickel incorporation protein HypA/HybF